MFLLRSSYLHIPTHESSLQIFRGYPFIFAQLYIIVTASLLADSLIKILVHPSVRMMELAMTPGGVSSTSSESLAQQLATTSMTSPAVTNSGADFCVVCGDKAIGKHYGGKIATLSRKSSFAFNQLERVSMKF